MSVQIGFVQTRLLQIVLWQSVPTAQDLPGKQAGQRLPPQSLSVSEPFLTLSVQER